MTFLNFLAQHPDLAVLAITTVGGLIWHGKKTSARASLRDTLRSLGRAALPLLIKEGKLYDDKYVIDTMESKMWAGLAKLKVPRNPLTERLVHEVVIELHDELAAELFSQHIDGYIEASEKTGEMLAQATAQATTP